MGNFVTTVKDGKEGLNLGITTGIRTLDKAMNGIQKKMSIGLAAAPKTGKTAFADYCFLIAPYLYMKKHDRLEDIEWIYFSFEIDRISKEFKMAALFMFLDHGIYDFEYDGKRYEMNQDYLMGRLMDHNEDGSTKQIKLSEEHDRLLKEVYLNRIIPIFGEYDPDGRQIRKGKITFIEEADNPTGMYKFCWNYAMKNGQFNYESYYTINDSQQQEIRHRVIGYTEKNPKKYTIIITDHARKCIMERGFTMKQNIDKWLEYSSILRNRCNFTFVNILHSNRGVTNVDRLKMHGDKIFPTADDIKDTGNLAEESTILMTLFNPHDEKYNLDNHFGIPLANHPMYRSLHITESRYTPSPRHIQLNAYEGINYYEPLIPQSNG